MGFLVALSHVRFWDPGRDGQRMGTCCFMPETGPHKMFPQEDSCREVSKR